MQVIFLPMSVFSNGVGMFNQPSKEKSKESETIFQTRIMGVSMRYGVTIDLGTCGDRARKIDLDTEEIRRTVITLRNHLPGVNVMNHMDFSIHYVKELAHGLSINAVKNLFKTLDMKSGELERLSISGNPIQLSIFQGRSIKGSDDIDLSFQPHKS
jgi:uncharacterized 2Fe-2S/4Fe-4S cluster protein (DUF4445 family)